MNDAAEPATTWWPWAARGLVALAAAGGLVAAVPDTLEATARVLGLYFLADAPLALLVATLGPTATRPWLAMVFAGLVELALAFVALGHREPPRSRCCGRPCRSSGHCCWASCS